MGVFGIVFPMYAGQSAKLKWSPAKPKALIILAKEYAKGFGKWIREIG
jgi:hypothetical protein